MLSNAMNPGRPWRGIFFAAVALLAMLCSGRAQTYEGRELVQARLLVNVTAIIPGRPFTVRLLLHMVANWPDPKVARASWQRHGAELQLTVESAALASYPAADFFPLPDASVVVAHPKAERAADGKIVFRVPIETADKNLSGLDGIVVFG